MENLKHCIQVGNAILKTLQIETYFDVKEKMLLNNKVRLNGCFYFKGTGKVLQDKGISEGKTDHQPCISRPMRKW